MGRNPGLATIALMLVLIGSPGVGVSPAHADDGAARKEARNLLDAGDRRMQRGERHQRRGRAQSAASSYREALESYQKAYELVPNPAIFFAIARAEEKLERWLDAVEHYQRVIREVDNEDLRARARERIGALGKHVAMVHFQVTPEGAEISLDRQLKGPAPLAGPVVLEPGDYRVTVTAPGYTPYEAVITVQAGKVDERVIELRAIPVVVRKPRPMQVPAVADEEMPRLPGKSPAAPDKGPVVVGAVLTGALLSGAAVTGSIALSRHRTFHSTADAEERQSARVSGKRMALVTDGLLAGAVLAGTYTAYRYFLVYRPERAALDRGRARRASSDAPAIWVAPYAAAEGGGLAAGGRF